MSRKIKYIVLSMVMTMILFTGCQQGMQTSAPAIQIEDSDEISQIQVHAIKTDIRDYPSKKLESLIKDLEGAVPLGKDDSKSLTVGDDFISIIFIYEDGEKDIFLFFKENEKWYLEHDENFYSDVDFIENYIQITNDEGSITEIHFPLELAQKYLELAENFEQLDIKYSFLFTVERYLYQGYSKEEAVSEAKNSLTDKWKLYKTAQNMDLTLSDDEVSDLLNNYISDISEVDNFKDYESLFDEFHTSLEEIVRKSKGYFAYTRISNELYALKFKEFAAGNDTINGTVYDSVEEYYNAFLEEIVNSYELTDKESKQFLEELKDAEEFCLKQKSGEYKKDCVLRLQDTIFYKLFSFWFFFRCGISSTFRWCSIFSR